ncbi:MAG: pilus assembly protein PilP [Deltaproteobacteria bacterium]|nr:pilus assembly protein PilP [Deltaproteobacteria bacterium]
MIQLSKIVLIFCLMGALTGHTGCSKPEAPSVKPEIVRKKLNQNTGESVKTEPVSAMVPGNPGATSSKPDIVRKKIIDKPESVKAVPVSGINNLQLPDGGVQKDPIPNKPSSESPNPLLGQVASISAVGVSYDPVGKIDPFVPLLKDDPLKDLPDTKAKREKREPTTPLERVDLSQLKLTAIIRTPSGFKAMVEETTGKGYIVTVGTYVGIHSGKVTNILKDRVVVEEEVEDALGNVANHNSELKFQKPPGEL